MRNLSLLLLSFAVAFGLIVGNAMARPLYKTVFQKQYNIKKPSTDQEKSLAAAVKKASACNVCHIKKKKKKVRNAYGEALKKHLKKYDKERVKKDKEAFLKEIAEALKKVEKDKSESGKTFGELIQAGKLPAPPPPKEEEKK